MSGVHDASKKTHVESVVLQRYIEDPFLLDGRKFDYRCYLLMVTTDADGPGDGKRLHAFFHNGYVRSAGQKYHSGVSEDNWGAHITNFSVQKQVRSPKAVELWSR